MAVAIDQSILEAAPFNGIKQFEQQTKSLDSKTLDAIASIFVEHDMHTKFGAGLLHRHEELHHNSVMIHKSDNRGIDICLPTSLSDVDVSNLKPHSWFLNQEGLFQAFEYKADGEAVELDPLFALQFRSFLQAHGLEDRISIIPSPAALGDTIEFTHPSGTGTIRIPLHLLNEPRPDEIVPVLTGWSFHVNVNGNGHGVIECKGNNVCAAKKNGNHQVFQDSKPFTEVKAMYHGGDLYVSLQQDTHWTAE